jgi:DNA primase
MKSIQMTPDYVERFLGSVGIEILGGSRSEIYCSCPFHDDSHASFWINRRTGLWICAAGCGKGSIDRLAQMLGVEISIEPDISNLVELVEMYLAPKPKPFVLSDNYLKPFKSDNLWYLWDRGFSQEILEKFEVGFDNSTKRIVIPARNKKGQLMGIIRRATKSEQKPKYLYSEGMGKSELLFGMDKMDRQEYIILVEGSLDCMWMHQMGFTNTVSILGSSLSEDQAELLKQIEKKVLLFFDNDTAGYKGMFAAAEALEYYKVYVPNDYPEGKNDPQELTYQEISNMIENRKFFLEEMVRINLNL